MKQELQTVNLAKQNKQRWLSIFKKIDDEVKAMYDPEFNEYAEKYSFNSQGVEGFPYLTAVKLLREYSGGIEAAATWLGSFFFRATGLVGRFFDGQSTTHGDTVASVLAQELDPSIKQRDKNADALIDRIHDAIADSEEPKLNPYGCLYTILTILKEKEVISDSSFNQFQLVKALKLTQIEPLTYK